MTGIRAISSSSTPKIQGQNADIGTEMAVSGLPRILRVRGSRIRSPPIQHTFDNDNTLCYPPRQVLRLLLKLHSSV
jgi:hypothetical protein